jgi:hypothetical protein
MSEIIDKVKATDSAIEADPLHRRILDWILYHVCSNESKKFERRPKNNMAKRIVISNLFDNVTFSKPISR